MENKTIILTEENVVIIQEALQLYTGMPVCINSITETIDRVEIMSQTNIKFNKCHTINRLMVVIKDGTVFMINHGDLICITSKGFYMTNTSNRKHLVVNLFRKCMAIEKKLKEIFIKLEGKGDNMKNETIILTKENLKNVLNKLQAFENKLIITQSDWHYCLPSIIEEVAETNTKDGEERIDFIYKKGGFCSIHLGAEITIEKESVDVKQMSPYEENIDYSFTLEVLDATNPQRFIDRLNSIQPGDLTGNKEKASRVLVEFVKSLGYDDLCKAYYLAASRNKYIPIGDQIKYEIPGMNNVCGKLPIYFTLPELESLLTLTNTFNPESITEKDFMKLQQMAKEKIESCVFPTCKRLVAHWYSIVNGEAPFGITIFDNNLKSIKPKAIPFENEEGDKLIRDASKNIVFVLEGLRSLNKAHTFISNITLDAETEKVHGRIGTILDQLIIEYNSLKK